MPTGEMSVAPAALRSVRGETTVDAATAALPIRNALDSVLLVVLSVIGGWVLGIRRTCDHPGCLRQLSR